MLLVAGVAVAVADPFASSSPAASGVSDNGAATAIATVKRMDLSQQTQVSATLGYAGASTVSVPSGTAPATLEQAQQSTASAEQTASDDERALAQAQASLDADRRKVAIDCRGGNAAESGTGPCAGDSQALTADHQSVTAATGKVQADERAVAAAEATLVQGEESAATYGQDAVYTMLPKVGQIVHAGQPLYAINAAPAFLLYGGVPASRAFIPGMSAGRGRRRAESRPARLRGAERRRVHGVDDDCDRAIPVATSRVGDRAAAARLGRVRAGPVRVTSVTPTARLAGAGRARAGHQLDSSRGDDRPRRVAADEHQGRRPGAHHAPGQLDDAGTCLVWSAPWRRRRTTRTAAARARRRSRWTSPPTMRQRRDGSTRRRSTSRSRRQRFATSSPSR